MAVLLIRFKYTLGKYVRYLPKNYSRYGIVKDRRVTEYRVDGSHSAGTGRRYR